MSKRSAAKPSVESPPSADLVDEIVLGGMRVQVRGLDLPLDDLKLDPANPRVANTVAVNNYGTGEDLQIQLGDLLWSDSDVRALYQSIQANRGLIERIIVRHNRVVAEGNCRTVVYRKLRENFPDDPTWRTIPARQLPADISDKQVAMLLGELHVGGKNQWSAFEKAGHIHSLYMQHGLVQEEIAKLLKTSKTVVNHNIRAFAAMKDGYLKAFPGPGSVRKFSYFLELYKQPALREWATDDPAALPNFVNWVGTKRIARGEDVRDLVNIVSNPRALAAFSADGFVAARKVLEKDRPELTSPLFKSMVEMTEALRHARLDEVTRVRKDDTGGAKRIVRELKVALEHFIDLCDGVDE